MERKELLAYLVRNRDLRAVLYAQHIERYGRSSSWKYRDEAWRVWDRFGKPTSRCGPTNVRDLSDAHILAAVCV